MSSAPEYTFTRDAGANRYLAHCGDEHIGFMSFREAPTTIVVEHTVVDEAHQGRGVASDLVEFALRDLRDRSDKRIVPQCSYVAMWIRRHPEYAPLTTRGTGGDDVDTATARNEVADRLDAAKAPLPNAEPDTDPTAAERFGKDTLA